MNVQDAVAQIDRIHAHLERTENFRGYRSTTVAFSGLMGILGAGVQALYLPDAITDVDRFLLLWIGIAIISVAVTGCEMAWRCVAGASPREVRSTRTAVLRFLPCLVAGALVTWVLRSSPELAWLFPGLWAVLFSLGVFSSADRLPPGAVVIGIFYLLTGVFCLAIGQGERALAPWTMVMTFGVGQLLTSVLLWFSLERKQ